MTDTNAGNRSAGGLLGLFWDGRVTAGNVLTALPLVVFIVVWGVRLESRVDWQDERHKNLADQVRLEQARDAAAFAELKAELLRQGEQTRAAIERLVDRLDRRVDRRPDTP